MRDIIYYGSKIPTTPPNPPPIHPTPTLYHYLPPNSGEKFAKIMISPYKGFLKSQQPKTAQNSPKRAQKSSKKLKHDSLAQNVYTHIINFVLHEYEVEQGTSGRENLQNPLFDLFWPQNTLIFQSQKSANGP